MIFNSFNINAQYKVQKNKYDYRHYTYQPGDRCRPFTAAIGSLFIPGLGQMICGEGLRGTGYLFGCAGSLFISGAGLVKMGSVTESDPNFSQVEKTSYIMYVGGLAGVAVFWIWSIADAPRVAKVKNLALRDKRKVSGNFSIQPYLNFRSYSANTKTMLGLSVNINF